MTPFYRRNDCSLLLQGEEGFLPDHEDQFFEMFGAHMHYKRCACGSVTFHIIENRLICAHCIAEITNTSSHASEHH
jgi:hypothetical protein